MTRKPKRVASKWPCKQGWIQIKTCPKCLARYRTLMEQNAMLKAAEKLKDALLWCSGAPCFNEGGEARKGWIKGPQAALAAYDAAKGKA